MASLRSLRVGLVVVTVLLVTVLLGYIGYGYAKRKAQDALREIPRELGMDITQETDNFTYTQSLKDVKIFTVHASKALQHKNGLVTLKEAEIKLYGTTGTRHDRIHGQEFEYDQKDGILRAVGEALIDLGPPGDKQTDEAHMIHVRTSGLVFRQREGSAETSEGIQFTANGLTGEAVGATYNSKTNLLTLQSAVKVSGQRGAAGHQRPLLLTATHAELNRTTNLVQLERPKYVSSSAAGEQTVSAAQAVVHTDTDGKPQAIEARGNVQLSGQGRGNLYADRLDMQLNDEGQPREGHLYGGVRYVDDSAVKQEQGTAQDVRVSFAEGGKARHALLTGAVHVDEVSGLGKRHLDADRLDLTMSGGGKEKLVLRSAVATAADGARLHLLDKTAKGTSATDVRATTLTGRFVALGLSGLDGVGNTALSRIETNPAGQQTAKETSTGDTLSIELKQAAPSEKKARMELARAVQHGSVEIVREAAAKKPGAPPEVEHARGVNGDYDADRDQLTLTGGATVSDETSAIFADKVQLDRRTGDALADGAVRVSYLQGKAGSEPVHVLAEHAIAHKASGMTEFTAAAGARVRMWQGGSQVEAPVLDFDRTRKIVVAHGAGEADAVRTTLASQPEKSAAPVHVLSERMTYTDAARQVDFAGHVLVKEAAGTLHAQDALVFLSPAAAKTDAIAGLFGGKLERIVGTGSVSLEQPGSKATGEKIVYTAADDTYVLTGTKAIPPRLDDAKNGNVTGTQLRFKRGDESVEVVGGDGARVRSEPRARE